MPRCANTLTLGVRVRYAVLVETLRKKSSARRSHQHEARYINTHEYESPAKEQSETKTQEEHVVGGFARSKNIFRGFSTSLIDVIKMLP